MKQNHKQLFLKRILVIVVLVGIAAGCALRIAAVNAKYPNPELVQNQLQESFSLNGLEVTVQGYKLLTVPEIQEVIPDFDVTYVDAQGNNKDERILLVEVHLFNPDFKEYHYLSVANCYLRSGAYRQGFSLNFFSDFNGHLEDPFGVVNPGVAPGDSVTVYLPYHIFSIQFLQSDWENIDTRTFELLFSWYPVKLVVTLV